ncbi:MAG: hypothetical protein IKP00_02585 [Victivallales bacterium]|nr:hypothetical protein [Victivallales bacterium]
MTTTKQFWLSLFCLLTLIAASSCNSVSKMSPAEKQAAEEAAKRRERISIVRSRLDKIHTYIEDGELDKADAYLVPLKSADFAKDDLEFFNTEIAMLENTIENMRKLGNTTAKTASTKATMLHETESQLALPETYGKTVVIDAKLPPPEIPAGPMEEILRKNVSLTFENAGIAELVVGLRETCKLNLIADDALQEEKTLSIAVEDVPLTEIFAYISRNMGVAFHLGQNLIWVTKSTAESGPLLETQIIRLRQGAIPKVPTGGPGAPGAENGGIGGVENKEDTELDEALAAVLADSPAGSTYKIFRDRNIIIIKDTRENIRLCEKIIKEFDKPPYQVAIEARFITVAQDDLKDIGIELSQMNAIPYHEPSLHTGLKTIKSLTSLGALTQGAESGVGLVNFSGVIENRVYDILVSALDKKNSTVTLSVPKITVMNNRQARIRKGDKLYYFEEYDVESINGGDNGDSQVLVPSGTPTELPIGLTFDVNVNVGNDGKTILLGLKPEIVEFKGWETYMTTGDDDDDNDSNSNSSSGNAELTQIKLPRTYEKSLITTVGVSSGQTVVLGGMLENSKSKIVKQVPFLGDIPLLGWLFRHSETTYMPTNLLIFVTATVINDRGEYVDIEEK